jgi:hypothetical protein
LSDDKSLRPTSRRVRTTLIGSCVIAAAASGCSGAPGTPAAIRGTAAARGFSSAVHASATAGLGASFDARDGSGGTYRVRLDLIVDPAKAAGRSAAPKHGTRLVGVVFTIKAISGRLRREDPGRLATVVGSNGKTYVPGNSPIAGYAGFRNRPVNIARGASETGAVAVQMPSGVTVSIVRWPASSGSGSMITWLVR